MITVRLLCEYWYGVCMISVWLVCDYYASIMWILW